MEIFLNNLQAFSDVGASGYMVRRLFLFCGIVIVLGSLNPNAQPPLSRLPTSGYLMYSPEVRAFRDEMRLKINDP